MSASLSLCQQNSVPHLRTRLQLQQAIMKELLQRQAQEKLQRKTQEQNRVQVNTLASTSGTSNSTHVSTNSQGVQSAMVGMLGPASATAQSQNQRPNMKMNNVTATVPPSSIPSSSSGSLPAAASIPLPISTTSLTAQLREQLAKITPQQGQLYMQQLAKQQQQLQQQQQQSNQQITGATPSGQQPANVNQATRINSTVSVTALNSNALKVTAQPANVQQLLEQQQRLVKEQQQVSLSAMGSAAVKQNSPRLSVSPASTGTPSNHLGPTPGRTVGVSVSPSRGVQSRPGFADMKVVSGVSKSASPPSSAVGKGKGKVKSEAGKNAADE